MDAIESKHHSEAKLDKLLAVDTRQRAGRLGSLEPLSTSASPSGVVGVGSGSPSPPVSPSNAALALGGVGANNVLSSGGSKRSPPYGNNHSSPSPGAKSAVSGSRLEESLDSVASFASLSGSFDISAGTSPQGASASPGQLNPVSLNGERGTKGTTTHSKSRAMRRERDAGNSGDNTKVVEVTGTARERVDARATKTAGGGGTSRSKAGWDTNSNDNNNDDFFFGEANSPVKSMGVGAMTDSPSNANTNSNMDNSSPSRSMNETLESLPSSTLDSVVSSPEKDLRVPSPHRTTSPRVALASVSPSHSHASQNQNNQQSPGNNSATNNSASVVDSMNSIDYDEYGDDDFEDDDAQNESYGVGNQGQDSHKDGLYETSFDSDAGLSARSEQGFRRGGRVNSNNKSSNNNDNSHSTLEGGDTRGASLLSEVMNVEDMEESVASEDIDAFEVSTGAMSDSFSLLNESQSSMGSKSRRRVLGAGLPKQKGGNKSGEGSRDHLEDSHRSEKSEGMEFSVSESEISAGHSYNFDSYDFAANALPPLKEQGGGRRQPKSGW